MRACLIAVALVAGLGAGAPARAEPRWYGERILAVDATSDALLLWGLLDEGDLALYAGLGGYALGAPIVHAAHGEWARAGASLGLRVALPALGGLIGQALCFDDTGFLRCVGSLAVGVGLGGLAAQIIDPATLAYTDDGAPAPAMLRLGGRF